MVLFLMALLYGFNIGAQAPSDPYFDSQDLIKLMKQNEGPLDCPLKKDDVKQTVDCHCDKNSESKTHMFALEYGDLNSTPEKLKHVFGRQALSQDDKFVVIISLTNDNLNLSPLAIGVATLSGNKKLDGNDIYKTHGTELSFQNKTETGLTYTFSAKTDLYTVPLNGGGYTPERKDINFSEDNVFEILVDSKAKAKTFYWKAGLGWQWVNREKLTTLGGTGQQQIFHSLVNSENQAHHNYLPSERPSESGGFVEFSAGLMRSLSAGGSCRFDLSADAGFKLGKVPKTTAGLANASSTFILSGKKSESAFGFSSNVIAHSGGVEADPMLFLSYRRKTWGLKSSVEFPTGQLQNYMDYNLDKEPIARMTLYVFVPNNKKKTGVKK